MKHFGLIIALALVFSLYSLARYDLLNSVNDFLAGVFFIDSVTEAELKNIYNNAQNSSRKIRVLIVPGHDNENGGTGFRGAREADLNVALAKELVNFFSLEEEFDAILARDYGGFNAELLSYFDSERESIKKFSQNHKAIMDGLAQNGLVDTRRGVEHNTAPSETVLKLYGINKWAGENDIDLVIHIHFNDYAGRRYNQAGKYSGFAIYVPERQFSNAKVSRALASSVFEKLSEFSSASDLPAESAGIIEDRELIAIGAFNTLDPAVLFIEYGYIYEPKFINLEIRDYVLRELAFKTVRGIKDFFDSSSGDAAFYATAILPHNWNESLKKGDWSRGVLALQTALRKENLYPPISKTLSNCPISGYFGECTMESVIRFQEKYRNEILAPLGLNSGSGFVGRSTIKKLNELFSY